MVTTTLTTGVSVPLLGTMNIPATLIDDTVTNFKMQFDISGHTSINTASLDALCEISFDAGLTWRHLCGCGRDKGYDGTSSLATIIVPLPAGAGRMLRASLTSSGVSVTTSLQVVVS